MLHFRFTILTFFSWSLSIFVFWVKDYSNGYKFLLRIQKMQFHSSKTFELQLLNKVDALRKPTLGCCQDKQENGQPGWRGKMASPTIHQPLVRNSVKDLDTMESNTQINASVGTIFMGTWRWCQKVNVVKFVQEMRLKSVVQGVEWTSIKHHQVQVSDIEHYDGILKIHKLGNWKLGDLSIWLANPYGLTVTNYIVELIMFHS